MQLLVVLGALSRDRRDGEYSLVDALVGGEEKRMAQWREVERQMLKMISGLTIAVFLALNTPKFFLLFGSLALVYALAHALAPRAYGRLREAQMALRLMMKPFVSLGARYKRARSRRTKKRERRARFEAMRQDRQALLKAEKLQRLARLAQEEDTPVVATSETVYKDAGVEFRQEQPELETRRKARKELWRYLEAQGVPGYSAGHREPPSRTLSQPRSSRRS